MFRFHIPTIILLTGAGLSFIAMHPTPPPADVAGIKPVVTTVTEHTGRITGWKLDNKGSVYFRLEGQNRKQKPFRLWFVTPASQTSTTEFERLVLLAVLKLHQPAGATSPTVVVRGDDSNDKGRRPEDAMDLLSIARL